MILIFCGCDKTGKSTLIKEVHKATNYKYPIIDRFTDSSIVYGKYRNRKLNYNYYKEIEKSMIDQVLLVYITANYNTIKDRIIKNNEKDINYNEIKSIKDEYQKYLNKYTLFKYITIDTSINTIRNCVYKIVKEIKLIENEDGIEQIKRLINLIMKRGEELNNTKELRNLNFKFNKINIKNLNNFLKFDKKSNEMKEKLYYNRIYHTLKHIINSQLIEYNQNLFSRRFIFNSNECIDTIHAMYRNNILECFIDIRSSNVKDILPLDIYYCYKICNNINKDFFKAKKIDLNFHIGSAHVYIK